MTDHEADLHAVTIYGSASRDVGDVLDMINECTDLRTLETLVAMLSPKPHREETDHKLNVLLLGPAQRRLALVRGMPS